MSGAAVAVRPYHASEVEAIVALALRAWEPVFPSIERSLGPAVYGAFYPEGWRPHQERAVRAALAEQTAWVAAVDDAIAGFVTVTLDRGESLGEIHMLAVDPERQRRGIGRALTEHALAWMRQEGLAMAMVETGADPGHAAARRTYERAGFGLWPVARYFLKLEP